MAKKVYEETNIAAIAETIREKTGGEEKYTTAQMPGGVGEVFEAGKKAEYYAFWENALSGSYNLQGISLFSGAGWNDKTFNPPKKITVRDNCNNVFYASICTDIRNKVEFTGVTSIANGFLYSSVRNIGIVDLSLCSSALSSFASGKIESIDKIIVSETTGFSSSFNNASNLTEMIFEGVLGKDGLNLKWSTKLSKESIISIINALSTTTSVLSITVSLEAVKNAFATSDSPYGQTSKEWKDLENSRTNWTIGLL